MSTPDNQAFKCDLLKSLTFAVLFLFISSLSSSLLAQKKPIPEQEYKVEVSADKDNAIYTIGEKIKFSISLLKKGTPLAGVKINYRIARDGLTPEAGSIVSAEKPVVVETSLDKSGFVLMFAYFRDDNKKIVKGLAGAAVEPLKIEVGAAPPADFDEFWNKKIDELKKLPLDAKLTPVELPKKFEDRVEFFDVQINCPGGKPVSGYFAKPKGAKEKSLPAYISYHGAGVRSSGKIYGRAMGYNALAMDVNAHGIENGKDPEFYKALYAGPLKGYPHFNSDDREKSYFLGMFLRVYRALQFLKSQPEWDGKTLIVYGSSQGGGQALAAAGLDPQVTFCIAKVPALCDHLGIEKKRSSGWPRFVRTAKNRKLDVDKVKKCSSYFDAAYFASKIKGKAILTVGFIDGTCCPTSVYAAYNNIKGEKEIINNINLGHRNCPKAAQIINKKIKDYLAEKSKK